MNPAILFPAVWGGWALSWIAAAWWSAPTVARPTGQATRLYHMVTLVGIVLLAWHPFHRLRIDRLWDVGHDGAVLLALLTLPGFLFAWWARLHLGRLWSGRVTRKAGHRIVETGPYAIVRHPIYTGLLAAALVSAIAGGTLTACAGLLLVWLGFWLKARLEERFLSAELGEAAYAGYRRRVPMLIPRLRTSAG